MQVHRNGAEVLLGVQGFGLIINDGWAVHGEGDGVTAFYLNALFIDDMDVGVVGAPVNAVSYTHLTLPTNREV